MQISAVVAGTIRRFLTIKNLYACSGVAHLGPGLEHLHTRTLSGGAGRGVLTVYVTGGSMELHNADQGGKRPDTCKRPDADPKKYTSLKF